MTTESRGRFESGFGYFEVFKKKLSPYALGGHGRSKYDPTKSSYMYMHVLTIRECKKTDDDEVECKTLQAIENVLLRVIFMSAAKRWMRVCNL